MTLISDSPELLILTDLDDSLFSTIRKIPASQRAGKMLAARAANGKESFMTRKQQALISWMDLSRCVPVTARGTEAYSRVTLPFSGPAAILANGAVLLNRDKSVNETWAETVNTVLQPLQTTLYALSDTLQLLAGKRSMNIRSWAVVEPSCGAVYAVAKSNDSALGEGLSDLLEDLRITLCANDANALNAWQFHINGNNLSITPVGISKAIAARYLLDTLDPGEDLLTIGVGDSETDLAFMRLCNVWLTPAHSQIDQLL